MKVLICVLGQLRHEDITWKPFKRNVLDVLGADMVTCGKDSEKDSIYNLNSLLKINSNPKFDDTCSNALYVLAHRKKLFETLKSTTLIDNYDIFILTRSDQIWYDHHPHLDTKRIWFMNCEFHFGISDRHTVVPKTHLESVCQFQNEFDSLVYRNIEMYLYTQYQKNGIWNENIGLAYFPMFLCDEHCQARRPDEIYAPRQNFTFPFTIDHTHMSFSGMFCGRVLLEGQHVNSPANKTDNFILNIP